MRFAKFFAAPIAAALAVLGVSVAVAPTAQAVEDSKLRVGHFSTETPPVDVYVDGKKTFAQVKFPLMSAYSPIASGGHTIEVRNAGAPASDKALISLKGTFGANKSYMVPMIGQGASLSAEVVEDDLTPPAKGKSKVRVIHTAVGGPNVDTVLDGATKLFTDTAYGATTPYSEVDAKKYDLSLRAAGSDAQLVAKQVALQDGGVYTVAAVTNADKSVSLRGFADIPGTATPTTVAAAAPAPAPDPAPAPTPAPEPAPAPAPAPAPEPAPAPAPAPTTDFSNAGNSSDGGAAPASPSSGSGSGSGSKDTSTSNDASTSSNSGSSGSSGSGGSNAAANGSGAAGSGSSAPNGAVDTGFGGLTGTSSTLATFGFFGILAGFVAFGLRRRHAS